MSRTLRVFPRRTKATPTDGLAWIGAPDMLPPEVDRVLVSCTFTWDIPEAERLAELWGKHAPTQLAGPALGTRGEEFVPGMFLEHGYTITSRGCPECCWFCGAWRRDGAKARELPIRSGFNVLDDNLLACSEAHIRGVFDMLRDQREPVEFTGGLHAARLMPWHVDLLLTLHPRPVVFLAYDEERDLEPLRYACRMLKDAGWYRQCLRSYVLCGYDGDTFEQAEERMLRVASCGADPMAMVFRDQTGIAKEGWRAWARQWIRPACMHPSKKGATTWETERTLFG